MRKQYSSPPNRAWRSRGFGVALDGEEVVRTNLIREDPRDALDDHVADGVTKCVVVALEARDVHDPDAAPANSLFDSEIRLDALHEPVEVQELRFRIAMRLVGQVGDDLLEVARDVADGDVLLAQLRLQTGHFGGKALGERLNRVLLRLLDHLPLPGEYLLDDLEQLGLSRADPISGSV